ncbi:MAG TPA: xanthine dehydrogenase family protein subunit M [Vicinamibacterales bacterium]|jgi:CO/xanthine dehydrogenase FAD-binding subunit|nr:xanthine dehydrogenase family protein subunit M [Vicinamibacterales bacterium]
MIPPLDRYELATPASLQAALEDLAAHPGARPFAGGTDLMVLLEAGHLPPGRFVSLSKCDELRGIQEDADGMRIGACTTYTEIRRSAVLSLDYPLLAAAASETGGVATQNRGTIGGNIANASPAADTPPALLVYDAELELRSASGTRRIAYLDFHTGYKQMNLRPDELIAAVHLPSRSPEWRGCDHYRKVGTRRAQAISKVCLAASMRLDGRTIADARIALGSVSPTVIRAQRAEQALRGRTIDEAAITDAERALSDDIVPIDDIRSTARYRMKVACNLLRAFLQSHG